MQTQSLFIGHMLPVYQNVYSPVLIPMCQMTVRKDFNVSDDCAQRFQCVKRLCAKLQSVSCVVEKKRRDFNCINFIICEIIPYKNTLK